MKLLRDTQENLYNKKQNKIKSVKGQYKEKERYRKKEQRGFLSTMSDFFSVIWNFFGLGIGPDEVYQKVRFVSKHKANKKKKHLRKIKQRSRRLNRT